MPHYVSGLFEALKLLKKDRFFQLKLGHKKGGVSGCLLDLKIPKGGGTVAKFNF